MIFPVLRLAAQVTERQGKNPLTHSPVGATPRLASHRSSLDDLPRDAQCDEIEALPFHCEKRCQAPPSYPMSSSASERPPRDKTSRPFATLDREKARRTGPREKSVSTDELGSEAHKHESQDSDLNVASDPNVARDLNKTSSVRSPSVEPRKLRTPYASLPPPAKREASEQPSMGSVADTPLPSSGTRSTTAPARSVTTPTRSNPSQCRKHQIQRNHDGVCLLCAKEAGAARGSSGRVLLWTGILAVIAAAALVAFLQSL